MAINGPLVGPGAVGGPGSISMISLGLATGPVVALEGCVIAGALGVASAASAEKAELATVTMPMEGAVQVHHRVRPLAPPGKLSPGSLVAPLSSATKVAEAPLIMILCAKSSLGGFTLTSIEPLVVARPYSSVACNESM